MIARRVCKEFAARHDDLSIEYVNSRECRTLFSVVNEILFELAGTKTQACEGLDRVFGVVWEALRCISKYDTASRQDDHIRYERHCDSTEFFYSKSRQSAPELDRRVRSQSHRHSGRYSSLTTYSNSMTIDMFYSNAMCRSFTKQITMAEEIPTREKLASLYRVAAYRPVYAIGIVLLSVIAALLEGIGLSFLLPIIELAQGGGAQPENADGMLGMFMQAYIFLGIPFSLGYVVAGVLAIMTVRFTSSFLVGWLRAAIETHYVRHLQTQAFDNALAARIAYFDQEGSDDILNAIVTQAEYAGRVIRYVIQTVEQGLLSMMYIGIALYLAPMLTIITAVFLGAITFVFRTVLASGYSLGDRVADANERLQESAQAGTQGIRDVKLFGMTGELFSGFKQAVDQFAISQIKLRRNQAAIKNFYQLATAASVFVLIYVALTFASLSIGALGVFLFAMFRLGPKISTLNNNFYKVEGELPHLVRTQQFIERLEQNQEPDHGDRNVPAAVEMVEFDDVSFSYDSSDEQVLCNVSFALNRGEFAAFVGPSGAGKSTIVSLLARMYDSDSGQIRANDTPIDAFDIVDWRSRISLVRQDPHIFNDTLRRNITIGNRDATQEEIERVCEIAQVTEFLYDLPEGYATILGDDGVRLSGGQRQRISIARALLKDADLLILDEATSDLDTSLEERVHEGVEKMDRDYAMLVIAHRLSTVTNADRIYTMEDGEIVESGPHGELVSQNGQYSQLYSLQSS